MIPYIGITGFMNAEEVLSVFRALPVNMNRKIMVGVLATSATLQGMSNSHPHRYPKPNAFARIFPPHPCALNLIHFHSQQPQTLEYDLKRAHHLAGDFCDGFQLNMTWPDPDVVQKIKSRGNTVVLQVGRRAFEMIGNSPHRLAMKIEREYAMIDYVLLDASGGKGRPLDACFMRPYLYALEVMNLPMGFAVAGGLGPHSLDLIAPFIEEFPDLSLDAEKALRDANDDLHLPSALLYRDKALAMFENR